VLALGERENESEECLGIVVSSQTHSSTSGEAERRNLYHGVNYQWRNNESAVGWKIVENAGRERSLRRYSYSVPGVCDNNALIGRLVGNATEKYPERLVV